MNWDPSQYPQPPYPPYSPQAYAGTAPSASLGAFSSSSPPNSYYELQWRDAEIMRLGKELLHANEKLREVYVELGELHLTLKKLQAFDSFSEGMAKVVAPL